MKVFIDQKVEAIADRSVDVAVILMIVIGVVGLFMAEEPVALQIDEGGFTSRVPPIVAAVVYPACGLLLRTGRRHPAVWVRWLARTIAYLLLVFQAFAVANAV